MPAYLTHYACGVSAFRQMEEGTLKHAASMHVQAYSTGLAGPDLFFYAVVRSAGCGMSAGRMIHKYRTGRFLQNLFAQTERLQGEERMIARAYLAGFLGHYCLDTSAHALVYRRCADPSAKKALGRHFRYEAAMDALCCGRVLGRDIRGFNQLGMLRLTGREIKVMSAVLAAAMRDTFGGEEKTPSALRLRLLFREYFILTGLLIDPTGFKEWIFSAAEQRIQGYPLLSPLFINGNRYGLGEKDWEQFYRRFWRGRRMHLLCLNCYGRVIEGRQTREAFFRLIGSRSYNGMYHDAASSKLPLRELYRLDEERPEEERLRCQRSSSPPWRKGR